MTSRPIPIVRSVLAAYAFFLAHWRPILIAGVPYTVGYALQLVLLQTQTGGETANAGLQLVYLLLAIGTFLASLALSAAALRMAVRGDFGGWLGLRLGRDELNIFLVSLLISALTLLVFLLVFMFWAVVFSSIALGSLEQAGIDPEAEGFDLTQTTAYLGGSEWGVLILLGLAAAAVILWLTARLILAFPATIAQRKVQVLSVWNLSHGQAWRIAAALVLAMVPFIVIEIMLYETLSALAGGHFLAMDLELGPEGVDAPGFGRAQEYLRWHGLMSAVHVPVVSGLYAYMYQTVTRPPRDAGQD
ncbi:hypothetical protein [Maricaulis sp. CAU 1757]